MPQVESLTNPIANLCRINCSVLPTRITPRTAVRQTQFRQSCIVATQVALSAVAVSLVEKSSNRTIGQNYRSRMRSTVECQLGWLAFATLEATSLASHATEASTCRPLRAQVLVLTARTDRTMGPSGRVFLAAFRGQTAALKTQRCFREGQLEQLAFRSEHETETGIAV